MLKVQQEFRKFAGTGNIYEHSPESFPLNPRTIQQFFQSQVEMFRFNHNECRRGSALDVTV